HGPRARPPSCAAPHPSCWDDPASLLPSARVAAQLVPAAGRGYPSQPCVDREPARAIVGCPRAARTARPPYGRDAGHGGGPWHVAVNELFGWAWILAGFVTGLGLG